MVVFASKLGNSSPSRSPGIVGSFPNTRPCPRAHQDLPTTNTWRNPEVCCNWLTMNIIQYGWFIQDVKLWHERILWLHSTVFCISYSRVMFCDNDLKHFKMLLFRNLFWRCKIHIFVKPEISWNQWTCVIKIAMLTHFPCALFLNFWSKFGWNIDLHYLWQVIGRSHITIWTRKGVNIW